MSLILLVLFTDSGCQASGESVSVLIEMMSSNQMIWSFTVIERVMTGSMRDTIPLTVLYCPPVPYHSLFTSVQGEK